MARKQSSGAAMPALVIIIIAVGLAGGLFWVAGQDDGEGENGAADRHEVESGGFDITIPVSGEMAALNQEEIRNELEERSAIMWIVPEGVTVKKGEPLLRLDDDELRDGIKEAQLRLEDAKTEVLNAQSNLDIRKQERDAEIAAADLDVRLTELALQAWRDGEEISTRKGLELAIETADKNHARLSDLYEKSVELAEQKYISIDEMRRDEISMIEARARLETARLDLRVYENYTYEQDKAQTESDVSQAQDKRERVLEEYDAKLRIAVNDLANRQANQTDREERLAKLEGQLDKTEIFAPCDGLVVYASSLREGRMGRNEGQPPQVGTELSRNERVMVIPDISQMVAEVKAPEALTGLIRPGQRVVVHCDSKPESPIPGEVMSVGVLAESGGWRDPNRRDYTIRVLLKDTAGMGLKPSMRCKAEIYVGRVADANYVPVQSVHRSGSVSFVYVPVSGGYAQRQVEVGQSSELYIEIIDGIEPGQVVLMREPAIEEVVEKIELDTTGWETNGNRMPEGMNLGGGQGGAPASAASPQGGRSPHGTGGAESGGGRPSGEGGRRPGGSGRPAGSGQPSGTSNDG